MLANGIHSLLGGFRASLNLTRLIISSPLPHTIIATLVILWFVFSAFLLIDNFANSQLDELIDPWLTGRPHFAWTAERCDSNDLQDLQQVIHAQGFTPLVSCVRSGKVQLLKKRPGALRFSEATAVEYQADLLQLVPAVTTNFADAQLEPLGSCLAELGEDPVLSGALGDQAIRSSQCDYDRSLPILAAGRALHENADLEAGATVAIIEEIFFDDLLALGDPDAAPSQDFIVTTWFDTGDSYLDQLLLLPPGSLERLQRYRKPSSLIVARTEGASSIAELVDLSKTLKRFIEERDLAQIYSVADRKIWDLQSTLIGTLRLIIAVISVLVGLTLFIGINQLIQGERKLFALARICGYRRYSILLALLYLTFLALLVTGLLAFVTSIIGGKLLTIFYFPELQYWFKPEGLTSLWGWSAAVAFPVGLLLLWMHFSYRIADELQRVRQDS